MVSLVAQRPARCRGEARPRAGRISLSVSQDGNSAASRLYAKLGYADVGAEPVRVLGQVMIRSGSLEVDDTLVYLVKEL